MDLTSEWSDRDVGSSLMLWNDMKLDVIKYGYISNYMVILV